MAYNGIVSYSEVNNTSIYTPFASVSNYDVSFRTDGQNQRMFIGTGSNYQSNAGIIISSNLVGIGRSNPTYNLDVLGNVNFTGMLNKNGMPYIASQWSNSGQNVFLLSSNVGICQQNPLATLDVNGSVNVASNLTLGGSFNLTSNLNIGGNISYCNQMAFSGILLTQNNTGSLKNATTTVTSVPGFVKSSVGGVNIAMDGPGTNAITFTNSNLTEFMRVNSNGYVGINNKNPAYTLDVAGSMNVSSNVLIGSNLTVIGTLTACNVEYVMSNIVVYNSESISSNLTVAGAVTVGSNMSLTNSACSFSNAGNESVAGTLYTASLYALNLVGLVLPFAGSSIPSGWILCYGQAVSRTIYSALFITISTTFGTGDGSTTFNIPDMRGRFAAGLDNMGGSVAGRITAGGSGVAGTTLGIATGAEAMTLSASQSGIQSHSHNVADPGHSHAASEGSHSHGITDPGHSHSVNDPGHAHTVNWSSYAGGGGGGGVMNGNYAPGAFINANTTGISIYGAGTGISTTQSASSSVTITGTTTGISISATSGGASASHPNIPPTIILNYIIKY